MTDLELRHLLPRGLDEILRLQRYLNNALDHLDTVPAPFGDVVELPPTIDEAVEKARCNLEIAHNSVGVLRDRLIELVRLVERMVAQRQSAAEAYAAGYEALCGSDRALIRPGICGAAPGVGRPRRRGWGPYPVLKRHIQ